MQSKQQNSLNVNQLLKTELLEVAEVIFPEGVSEQLHYHEKKQHMLYVLSGSAEFELNGESRTLTALESVFVPKKTLHKIANKDKTALKALVISESAPADDRIDIIEYSDELSEPIRILNYEWLEKYFFIEPTDANSLNNPKREIIEKGGMIFYAKFKNEIVGTVSLLRMGESEFELGKMSVTEKAQGHYIGNALVEHCLHVAKQKGIKKLILFSNTKMEAAIHLYRKYGFREVELETGHYERANIKMEKSLVIG